MTEPSANAVTETPPTVPSRLEPDAIGVAQDTIVGMATSAPATVVAISLAGLAATAAYGGGLIMLIAAVPMLIIANSYRRLNRWSANAGASFEWVGRSINPYLGFLTGLLFALFYILTALAGIAYFRRRIVRNVRDAITVGLLPLASAAFLAWMVIKSMMESPAPQNWSMLGVVVAGLILMLVSRFVLRSPFYRIRLESAPAVETGQEAVSR
jgi:amino acid transporter